jgi:hypothetical protein
MVCSLSPTNAPAPLMTRHTATAGPETVPDPAVVVWVYFVPNTSVSMAS